VTTWAGLTVFNLKPFVLFHVVKHEKGQKMYKDLYVYTPILLDGTLNVNVSL
jgi:hypothetical protein